MEEGGEREIKINTITYDYIEREIVYKIVEAKKLDPRIPFIVYFPTDAI
jgi:hypothetical protein